MSGVKKGKADVWMPLYIGDYQKDTRRLTTEQDGAYLLLIMDYWTNGQLPDDDGVLARICKLDMKTWLRHRRVIERFFVVSGGYWSHGRIDAELEECRERSMAASKRALAGANKRWRKECSGDAPSMLQACSVHAQSQSPTEREETGQGKAGAASVVQFPRAVGDA